MPDEWRVEERTGTAAVLHEGWPGAVAHPDRRALAVCHVTEPAVVLGSTQPASVLDEARVGTDGVAVARRRSGGGAVLVTAEDPVWIDAWLPAGDPLWRDDVGLAFEWLGEAWTAALGRSGVTGLSPHRGGYVSCTRWATSVCFGGVGAGEVVTADGRKVVGLAQRRNRRGAWFHAACYLQWDPTRLVDLLAMASAEREAAVEGLAAAVAGVSDLSRQAGHGPVGRCEVTDWMIASLP